MESGHRSLGLDQPDVLAAVDTRELFIRRRQRRIVVQIGV